MRSTRFTHVTLTLTHIPLSWYCATTNCMTRSLSVCQLVSQSSKILELDLTLCALSNFFFFFNDFPCCQIFAAAFVCWVWVLYVSWDISLGSLSLAEKNVSFLCVLTQNYLIIALKVEQILVIFFFPDWMCDFTNNLSESVALRAPLLLII